MYNMGIPLPWRYNKDKVLWLILAVVQYKRNSFKSLFNRAHKVLFFVKIASRNLSFVFKVLSRESLEFTRKEFSCL